MLTRTEQREFEVGDWVFLRLQPYRQTSLSKNHCHKLSPRYYGPFKVTTWVGKVAYRLELPSYTKIHNVFHVSLLKKKIGNKVTPSPTLPPMIEEGVTHWESEKILSRGIFKHKNQPVTRWLIHWKGFPTKDATWENAPDIQARFPEFKA